MAAPRPTLGVLREIERRGLLLVTDPVLPSVTTVVAGEPVRGSWWSHPKAHEIYAVLQSLEEERSVMLVKLVSKKETFVHESLWPELFVIATAKESWQMKGLSARALALLAKVEKLGSLRLDEVGRGFDRKALSRVAQELEERLLVHGRQVHGESGAHQKLLSSWNHRARSLTVGIRSITPAEARRAIESRTEGKLPWQRPWRKDPR
jgi:hypothetical protein